MLNVIRMDLYRLFRSVSTWVIMFVAAAITVITVFAVKLDLSSDSSVSLGVQGTGTYVSEEEVNMSFGIGMEPNPEWVDSDIKFSELAGAEIGSGMYLLFCAIFVAIFVNAEQDKGYIKNIAGQLPNRWMLVVSKLVAITVQVLIMFLTSMVVMFITGRIIFNEKLVMDSIADVIKVIGGQCILHIAFSSLVMFFTVLLRSSGFAMTLGVLITCKVPTAIYAPLNKFLQSNLKLEDFDMSKYALEMTVSEYNLGLGSGDFIRIFIVALCFMLCSALFASLLMQKRDVK